MSKTRAVSAIAIAICLASIPRTAIAQTVTVPSRIDVGCSFTSADFLGKLTAAYLGGDQSAFRTTATNLITALDSACSKVAATKINLDQDVVLLLWIFKDKVGKDDVIHHALLLPDNHDPFSTTMPGVVDPRRAFEIFLSDDPDHAAGSAYTSTRERDPLEEQLPAFAKAVTDPLMTLLASTAGTLKSAPPPPAAAGVNYATVSRLALPFARAAVHVDVRVVRVIHTASLGQEVLELSKKNLFATGAHAACARDLDASMKKLIQTQVQACLADANLKDKDDCQVPSADLNAAYDAAAKTCTSDGERKEALAVDGAYRELLSGAAPDTLESSFDLKNTPRQVLSLGLITAFGFSGGVHRATRVKTNDDGAIVADPLGRQMNLVVMNVALTPYDAEAFHPTPAERYRAFFGAVVTPDFGFAAGASALLVRGLSVNLGGAILGVRGMQDGDTLGESPTHSTDPFKLSAAYVAFVGVGYNFK